MLRLSDYINKVKAIYMFLVLLSLFEVLKMRLPNFCFFENMCLNYLLLILGNKRVPPITILLMDYDQ